MAKHNVDIRIGAKDHASKVFKRVAIAAGAFLGARAIGRVIKESTSLFIEQEKSTIKLTAALKATGNAAGFTQKQLSEYANELQNSTTIGNEAFESAMSVMATFRKVSGDTFKESIMLAADMSQALGTGLQGSVIQLGKALNDPIKGVSALSEVGVSFSEVQKKQIKAFQEAGDMASAQKVILDELTGEFGGQAKAQADSYGGSIAQMALAFGGLREEMGKAIAEMPGFQTSIKVATVVFQNFGDAVKIVWIGLKLPMIGFWEDFKHLFAVQIPELFKWFIQNWKDVFTTIWNGTKSVFVNLGKLFVTWAEAVANIFKTLGKAIWEFMKNPTAGFDIKSVIATYAEGWGNIMGIGLLDGFESTLKEMPNLAGRAMTGIENELAAELLAAQERLGKKIGEKLAPKAVAGGVPGGAAAGIAGAAAVAAGKRAGFGELVRFGAGVPRDNIASRSLQEQKKAGKRQENQERLQEQMVASLARMSLNTVAVTNFS